VGVGAAAAPQRMLKHPLAPMVLVMSHRGAMRMTWTVMMAMTAIGAREAAPLVKGVPAAGAVASVNPGHRHQCLAHAYPQLRAALLLVQWALAALQQAWLGGTRPQVRWPSQWEA
jgi:hypothetical protein